MKRYVCLLFIIILSGCVSTSVTRLDYSKNYPPVQPDQVKVYLKQGDVHCKYDKIALIKTKTGYGWKDEKSVKAARNKAASLGANGLILEAIKDPSTGDKIASALLWTPAYKKGTMVAIHVDTTGCSK